MNKVSIRRLGAFDYQFCINNQPVGPVFDRAQTHVPSGLVALLTDFLNDLNVECFAQANNSTFIADVANTSTESS